MLNGIIVKTTAMWSVNALLHEMMSGIVLKVLFIVLRINSMQMPASKIKLKC